MIKLAKPYIPTSALESIKDVLESGNLIQGKYVAGFETLVADYLDMPYVKMVSSGTAALHLALLALGIEKDDEVIVPAFTFPATANVVEIVGAKPVLVDINMSDYCINVELIEQKITSQTKAIIPVHEFGQMADIIPLMRIAKRHDLYVIEDAACALGAEYRNKKSGTYGDVGCFSLHPRKAITTGEGGIVVTHDKKLAHKIELLRNHGAEKQDGHLDFHLPGLNYRMTDFQAALGIPQLEELEQIIDVRKNQALHYDSMFKDTGWIDAPATNSERKHVYQTYHVIVKDKNRDDIITTLREQGIETNLGAQALHCLTYFANKYNFKPHDFPNSRIAYTQGLALPLGKHLKKKEIEEVCMKLKDLL